MSTSRRTVLVTGASSGIGFATAELFARKGWHVAVLARREPRLRALAERLQAELGAQVTWFALDVRDRKAVAAWREENSELLKDVEVLINNAGLARGFATVQEGDIDDWDEMIDANVKGLLYLTRAVLPFMVSNGHGHVVNVGSVAGRWVYPKGAVYCGTKHAVRAINEGLRLDLSGTGLRVSTVDPGMVDTEFSLVRFHGDQAKAASVYQGVEPLQAGDVAETIAWMVERPAHVNVAEVVLLPRDQASPTVVHRR